MHGSIGRVVKFAQQDRSKHRLEGLGVVPVRVWVPTGVHREVEVADHLDRSRCVIEDLVGLLCQQSPPAR